MATDLDVIKANVADISQHFDKISTTVDQVMFYPSSFVRDLVVVCQKFVLVVNGLIKVYENTQDELTKVKSERDSLVLELEKSRNDNADLMSAMDSIKRNI
jgi:hypothetical protein